MSKTKKVIIGAGTGAAVGIIMEILRGAGYVAGLSATIRAVFVGVLAFTIYTILVRFAGGYGSQKV